MAFLATIDWATWVTILLAAIGVLLAALGVLFVIASVVLGALAVFGFRELKTTAIELAGAAAKEAAQKAVESDEIREWMFAKLAQQSASKADASASEDTSGSANVPATIPDVGRLAATYPEEVGLPTTDVPPEHGEDEPNE